MIRSRHRGRAPADIVLVALAGLLLGLAACQPEEDRADPEARSATPEGIEAFNVGASIRDRIGPDPARASNGGLEAFVAGEPLRAFYEDRRYAPVWLADAGLSERGEVLVDRIRAAESDGLRPEDYHSPAIEALLDFVQAEVEGEAAISDELGEREVARLAELDLLLTDAFMLLGSHLRHGRVDQDSETSVWQVNRNEVAMEEVIEEALAGDGDHFHGALAGLQPQHPGYDGLREELDRHLALEEEGGWPSVSEGDLLREGDRGARVLELRERLAAERPEASTGTADEPDLFDAALHDDVVAFQRRHGLEADGVVGSETIDALNAPVDERIRRIAVSLERWRWLPPELGVDHIVVNVPGFETWVVLDGERAMTLRSIVGQEYRQTPVFSDEVTFLVLAPRWHVPPGLAARDHLPQIREDLGFLEEQHMVVIDHETGEELDPEEVDWDEVGESDFEERILLRQTPGEHNALGDIQLMFPNEYNVYVHDTPEMHLFDERVRDFSSGCIRVERALELAELLLEPHPEWDRERIEAAIEEAEEREVPLERTITIHIQYWTAWVDEDGVLQLREDIYQRDDAVFEALRTGRP